MNVNKVLKQALKYADRREFLAKNACYCPVCGTEQVQLINHFIKPAQWRCRHCETKFTFEPDTT